MRPIRHSTLQTPAWAVRNFRRARWLLLSAVLVSACGFDESGAAGMGGSGTGGVGGSGTGGTGTGGTGGTGTGGTGGTGGMPCTSSSMITGEVRVEGNVWTSDSQPAVFRIVGDTLTLDATQVSVPSAQPAFQWTVTPPNGTGGTLSPNANAQSVTVYATDPAEYHVTLTISDPNCAQAQPLTITVWAFTALGPQPVATNPAGPGANTINGIAAAAGKLWAATGAGGWALALAPPHTPWLDVQGTLFTSGPGFVQANLSTVYFDAADNLLWWGATMAQPDVNSIDLAGTSIDLVDIATNAGGNTVVTGFSRLSGSNPVYVACDKGLLSWTSGATAFANLQTVGPAHSFFALTQAAGAPFWVGGPSLYNMSVVPATGQDVFPGGDDKIRALALDGPNLWIGSDMFGLGRAASSTGTLAETLDTSTTTPAPKRLPSNHVREIVVDATDVWLATDQGVARYKQEAGAVVSYKAITAGMNLSSGQLDTRAIVVDHSTGVRRVFIGTSVGVLVLESP